MFDFSRTASETTNAVTDFTDGMDLIRVAGSSFAALTITAVNGGLDTQVELPGGTLVILQGVASGLIGADDVLFA